GDDVALWWLPMGDRSVVRPRTAGDPQVTSTASRVAGHGLAAAPSSGSHMSSFRMTETMCLYVTSAENTAFSPDGLRFHCRRVRNGMRRNSGPIDANARSRRV